MTPPLDELVRDKLDGLGKEAATTLEQRRRPASIDYLDDIGVLPWEQTLADAFSD